ncbi:signal peptidase I [Candidatus Woesearchaeota archaeon]|nr:signal peptidase I [Candidatus Woesearchaeota archaeon]
MSLLKSTFLFVSIILLISLGLFVSNNEEPIEEISLQDSFEVFKEENCVNSFDNETCTEKTYVQCNGERYKVPGPTGFTVKDKVYITEFVEKEAECITPEKLYGQEKKSPADRINNNDIRLSSFDVKFNVKNARWRFLKESNSMDPLLDFGSTIIEINPENAEIQKGDIISYNLDGEVFIHRIIDIGEDELGEYYITKGDNYYKEDPEKVRISQVEGVVVGILY